jgi:hypothetical protein
MARAKNENKLSSGFYRAHDFLRFGDVLNDLRKKADWWMSQKQMIILQNVDRLGFPFPNILDHSLELPQEERFEQLRQTARYGDLCNMEYDQWIDSLKFQFESGLLQTVIPPKAILNNFFEDLEIRMPHEHTLLIENDPCGITRIVRVEETTLRAWLRKYMDVKLLASSFDVKSEKEMFDALDQQLKGRRGDLVDGKVTRQYPWYEGLDQELAAINLTINMELDESSILKPERFTEAQMQALTTNTTTYLPQACFVPLGQTVGFYDKCNPIHIHTDFVPGDEGGEVKNTKYHLACVLDNPLTTPGLKKDGLFSSKVSYPFVEDVKKLKHSNNRHLSGDPFDVAPQAHFIKSRQVFLHMGIMNHPEFKSLCVEKLKMNGIQPNKSPYSAARPYTTRPTWRPPFEHYVVTINIPDEVSNESNASTHKKRHHLVRGHYMRTASKGFVWRKSHWRGNREMGVVTKDYVMDLEDKLQKTGRDDEKNISLNLRG